MSCYYDNYNSLRFLSTLDDIYNSSKSLRLEFQLLDFYPSSTTPSVLRGSIKGLDLYRNYTDLFEPGCFQSGCFMEPGSWSEYDEMDLVPDYSNSPLFSTDCFSIGCWDDFSHSCSISIYSSDTPNICNSNYELVDSYTDCIGYSPILEDYFDPPSSPNVRNFTMGHYVYLSNRYRQYITKLNRYYSGSLEGNSYVERGTTREKYFITYQNMFGSECYTNVPSPMGLLNLYFVGGTSPVLLASFSPDRSIVCKYNQTYSFEGKSYSSLLFIGSRAVIHEIEFLKSEFILNPPNLTYKDCNNYSSPRIITRSNRNFLYKDDSGLRLLWYPGSLDEIGNSYVVDIGYINDRYGEEGLITYYDYNVPLNSNGIFKSTTTMIDGILAIRLKRVTKYNITILRVFIYPLDIHLMRTYYLLGERSRDSNIVNLEALSISLIQIMLSGHLEDHLCVERRGHWYLEPYLRKVLKEEFDILYKLIDNISDLKYLSRYGSIPLRLSVFGISEPIYDDNYFPSFSKGLFVDYLFEPGCFDNCIYLEGADREISNRSLAWLLYALCSYSRVFPSDRNRYKSFINRIANYLISNIDHRYRLIYKGWTHNDIYSYSELIDDYPTSTNIVTCLALLKAYDVTKETAFLEVGTDLYQGILNYLYLPDMQVCAHSLDIDGVSLDSLLHSLWLFLELNNAPFVEKILNLLLIRLKPRDDIDVYTSIYYEDQMEDIENIYYNGLLITTINKDNSILSSIPFNMTEEDFINTLNDEEYQFIYLSLLSHRLNEALNTYSFDPLYIPIIDHFKNKLNQYDCLTHSYHSLIRTNILNNNLLFGHKLFKIECLESVNTLIASRKYLYNKLKGSIPTRFNWFSRASLLPSGNMGKMLLTFSKALAPISILISRISEFFILKDARGVLLDQEGEDILMPRFDGEVYLDYLDRMKKFMHIENGTRQGLMNLFELYHINSNTYRKKVIGTSDIYNTSYNSEFISDDYTLGYLYSEGSHDDEYLITDMNIPPVVMRNVMDKKGLGVSLSFITLNNIYSCNPKNEGDIYITPPSSIMPEISSSLICTSDCYDVYRISIPETYPYPLYINNDGDPPNILYVSTIPLEGSIDVLIPPNTQKVIMINP